MDFHWFRHQHLQLHYSAVLIFSLNAPLNSLAAGAATVISTPRQCHCGCDVMDLTSRFSPDILLVLAANNVNERMAPDGSSLHPCLPPSPCSPISSSSRFKDEGEWAGGREGSREGGREGARTVGRDESRMVVVVVVEVSLAQRSCFCPSTLTTPPHPSPPKNTLFLLAALFHPIIPLLRHCICFLIRSVWEAHEPFLQPLHTTTSSSSTPSSTRLSLGWL